MTATADNGWQLSITRYFAWSRHWDEETCRRHEDMGFTAGWNAVAAQLATLAEGGTID